MKTALHYCPCCNDVAETTYTERPDGTRRFEAYCVTCRRDYKRERYHSKKPVNPSGLAEHTPKLDAETLAKVSSDPLWEAWLCCPPRTELDLQHSIAVEIQRKYRCCYKRLSHSMRAAWCDEWEAKLGHAPYLIKGIA